MKKSSSSLYRIFQLMKNLIKPTWNYLKQGYEGGLLTLYCKHFVVRHLQEFSAALKRESEEMGFIEGARVKKLHQLTAGLHSLFPINPSYSYSILIPVPGIPDPLLLNTVESALNQTAPLQEVLVGVNDTFSLDVESILKPFSSLEPARLRIICFSEDNEGGILNLLAKEAKGKYLLSVRATDWIRPDYLYRCEQYLRLTASKHSTCLYTDEFMINSSGYPLPGKYWQKPLSLHFPYHFKDDVGHSLLIPKENWIEAGGMTRDLLSQGLWEFALRLEGAGCVFHGLPFGLYAHRALLPRPIENSESLFIEIEKSARRKGLNWRCEKGSLPQNLRAIPSLEKTPFIQVIIPYKNQKNLTLKAVKSALAQKGVSVVITAVNNNSDDFSIAEEIEKMGGEVIHVLEPFNYSRLNNLAVEKTVRAKQCEYLLFLNNDVELEEGALLEMSRWIVQPTIGLVGCWLSYPNDLLQHGGVDIIRSGPGHHVTWSHTEKMREPSKMNVTKTLRLVDGATAACALMRKAHFIQIGGFDEMWYPVAYSDTNLAVKLSALGLRSFYTPYAKGIHHESISREVENIEDVENSRWLHDLFCTHKLLF